VSEALRSMECIVVQDIFLNETAKFAHVLLPGSSFLEKDGTFTNAERRISRVRKVMPPLAGLADWEVTCRLSEALGYPMRYSHPSEIMDEIARLTPSFAGVSYAKIERLGSVQWPCNDDTDEAGTSVMHRDRFVRGRGRFFNTAYVPSDERPTRRFPLLLTTGRVLSQYNVGAQTRRTENNLWHDEDRLDLHPHDAETRGIRDGDWGGRGQPRRAHGAARARHRADAAGRGVDDLPLPGVGRQRDHHRRLRLGDQLPRVQGDRGAGDAGDAAVGVAARVRGVRPPPARAARVGEGRRDGAGAMTAAAAREADAPEGVRGATVVVHDAGGSRPRADGLAEEVPVALVVDGVSQVVMLATPADLEDFALGFALTEGLIGDASDLYDVERVDVETASSFAWRCRRRARGGCASAAARWRPHRLRTVRRRGPGPGAPPPARRPARGAGRRVDRPCAARAAGAAAARARHGRHPCGRLVRADGAPRLVREDVGRHNALDKLVGAASRARADIADGFVLVTSRASVEMVQKAAIAGAGALVAVSAPTAFAVDVAREAGLLLVGFVRGDRMVAYATPSA
jgi:formate dehydrogenase assembly factor FdhD